MRPCLVACFYCRWPFIRVLSARSAIRQRALKDFALAGMLEGSSDAWLDRRSVRHQTIAKASRIILAAATKFGPSDRQSKASLRMDMVKAGFFDPSAIYWYYCRPGALCIGAANRLSFCRSILTLFSFGNVDDGCGSMCRLNWIRASWILPS